MKIRTHAILCICLILPLGYLAASKNAYNPLQLNKPLKVKTVEETVKDTKRNREIPLLIYLPEIDSPAPVVLFSHGLGGSRYNNAYMGNHWSGRGYVAVFMQHAGSDESVWKEGKPRERLKAMKEAASAKNAKLRYEDVHAMLDQLEIWNQTKGHPLFGKLDTDKTGMSGHSFGAVTTQAVSGQQAMMGLLNFTDDRIKAAVAFSPSSPRGGNAKRAFSKVKIPWLLMTGTKDLSIIGNADLESRMAVFPALPPGDKYELVLDNAEHSAFSDRALPGDKETRNPNHHRAILALSTAFWDAYLKEDEAAATWLKGDEARSVLEEKDRWQKK